MHAELAAELGDAAARRARRSAPALAVRAAPTGGSRPVGLAYRNTSDLVRNTRAGSYAAAWPVDTRPCLSVAPAHPPSPTCRATAYPVAMSERYWRAAEPKAAYDVVDRGRRRTRPRHRLLPRRQPRHHRRLRGREGLAGRRQHGPQHHDHPLQLPVGRVGGDLRALAASSGKASRKRSTFDMQFSQRGVLNLAHDLGDVAQLQAPGLRQRAQRRRRGMARRRRGQGVLPDRERLARRALPGARRHAAAAGRRRAPRQGGVGVRARRRSPGRRHRRARRGDRLPPRRRRSGRGRRDHARHDPREKVALAAAGHTSVLASMVGLRLPLQSHPLQALVSALVRAGARTAS